MVLILIVISYVLGSIPFAVIIARKFSVDLSAGGTHNFGATNVFKVIGPGWGILTGFLDLLKGAIPVYLAKEVFGYHLLMVTVIAASAIFGHNWSVFLNFSGGRGLATTMGTVAVINFTLAFIAFITGGLLTLFMRKLTKRDLRLPFFVYPIFILLIYKYAFNQYILWYGLVILIIAAFRAWQLHNR